MVKGHFLPYKNDLKFVLIIFPLESKNANPINILIIIKLYSQILCQSRIKNSINN